MTVVHLNVCLVAFFGCNADDLSDSQARSLLYVTGGGSNVSGQVNGRHD